MPVILHVETSTRVCSAGISKDGSIIAAREDNSGGHSHSTLLTCFIDEVISEAGIVAADVSAVAASSGPGSYTGLRIGVSVAKGFCYARDIPLIAADTMLALADNALIKLSEEKQFISPAAIETILCPMIDARRMEVYHALFRHDLTKVAGTAASVIDKDSFSDILESGKIIFFGDGADKCKNLIISNNAFFLEGVWPSVYGMVREAEMKYSKGDFVDVAYFEPFYLKDFVAGKPKVKGLYS